MTSTNTELQKFSTEHGVVPDNASAGGKPKVHLPGGSVRINDTARELFTIIAATKKWFYKGGMIVILTEEAEHPLPVLKILKAPQARSEFEAHADLFTQSQDGPKPGVMSEDMAKALLQSSVARDTLPRLTGLINCPLLVLNGGKIHTTNTGYDETTGYFVTGKPLVEPADIEDATTIIKGAVADFSFQTDGDVSRAIASFLTPALKFGGFIKGFAPIEVVEANESQTGKGYFVLLRSAVYGESPVYVAEKRGGVGSLDESFGSSLIKGRPFIVLDNYRGQLGSPYLESFLTAQGNFSVRVPYSGEVYVDTSRYLVAITSNGMEATRDLANRSCFIRLKKQEGHRFHEFGSDDILETIRKCQPMFLGAVYAIVRHWFDQGMPKTDENRHSFSEWARSCDWIVQNIFKEAPLLEGHTEAQARFQNPHLTFARLVAIEIQNKNALGQQYTATSIFELCEEADIPIPTLADSQKHNADYGKRVVGKIMNKALSGMDELLIEGFRITRKAEPWTTNSGHTEQLKKYTFSLLTDDPAPTEAKTPSKTKEPTGPPRFQKQ